MITIIKDIELIQDVDKYDTIFIGTNVYGCMSQGAQRDIALKFNYCREANFAQKYGDTSRLGSLLETSEDGKPTIVLLYMYKGFDYRKSKNDEYLDYDLLEKCLIKANELYKGRRVATTLIGCSRFDGNGNRDRVLEILERTMTDIDLVVYDYHQLTYKERYKKIKAERQQLRELQKQKLNIC